MSDHIPFEIQSEIMKILPVKSLLRFQSVCKAWKSLIASSGFIAHYSSQQQHLLVRYEDAVTSEEKYVSIVDNDHTFPQHKVSVTVPQSVVNLHKKYTTIGCSHGLLCLYDHNLDESNMAVIWNPSVRKAVAVIVPNVVENEIYQTVLGFGVCRETNDPKIVKITCIIPGNGMKGISCIPYQVEVFTLSTRAWRSPYSTNLPSILIRFLGNPVDVDGCLYWLARDGTSRYCRLIISFDMTSEEFEEVNLPDSLVYPERSMFIDKLRESLLVIEADFEGDAIVYHVWMLEEGASKSFKKLYTISSHQPDVSIDRVRGFRKTGEPLIEVNVDLPSPPFSTSILAAYEPYSKSISDVGINGRHFSVNSYMETLLLL